MNEVEGGGPDAAVTDHGVSSATAEAAAAACESRNGLEHPQHPAASLTPEESSSDPGMSEQQQDGQQGSSRAVHEVAEAKEQCLRVSMWQSCQHTLMLLIAMMATQRRGVPAYIVVV